MAQIRGQFPFPISSPQTTGTPEAVTLASGGIYLPPAGEYLVSTGEQTVVQWWDQLSGTWRNYAGPETINQISCDGGNYRLINLSGVCVGASITNAGSGGTNGIGPVQTGSTVSFAAPASGGAPATAQGYVIVGGTVPAPTVTQGGSGFLVAPLVVCDPPPIGGVQATFTAAISAAGVLTGVTQVNPGAGYTAIPQFYIIPQYQYYNGQPRYPGDIAIPPVPGTGWAPGLIHPNNLWNGSPYQGNIPTTLSSGALLTGNALTGSGTLTGIVMSQFGAGYGSANLATVTFGGTSLGTAAATPIMSLCSTVAVGSSMTGQSGATYVVGMPIISSLGMVANTTNNNSFFARPIRGKVTNATGPALTVEDPGFGIQSAGTGVTLGPGGGTLGNVNAANLGGITDTSILQALVQ